MTMVNAEPTSAPARPSEPPRDRVAIVVGAVLLALAVVVGLRTGYSTSDVDEAVYRQTLAQMHHGDGYYRAMHDAMVAKERNDPVRPAGTSPVPSNARAYRLPTEFLLLYRVPAGALRWLVALPFGLMLWSAWRLGRPYGAWGGPASVGFVGLWVLGASPYLFLHAEIWGGALFLLGLVLVRERPRTAAAAFVGAVAVRELFAFGLAVALAKRWRSATWWLAIAALGILVAVHLHLAGQLLAPNGYQPPLHFTGGYLQAISPGDGPFGALVGIVGGVAGAAGALWAWRRGDEAARITLGNAAVLAPVTVLFGRTYWAYTWGPALAVFSAVALQLVLDRRRAATSVTEAAAAPVPATA